RDALEEPVARHAALFRPLDQRAGGGDDGSALVANRVRIDENPAAGSVLPDQLVLAPGHALTAQRVCARRHVGGHESACLITQGPVRRALLEGQPIEVTAKECARRWV